MSWGKRLGNGALVIGFIGMEGFSLFHRGYWEWSRTVDHEVFYAADQYYPTSTLIAIATGLVLGALGFVVGWAIDRRR